MTHSIRSIAVVLVGWLTAMNVMQAETITFESPLYVPGQLAGQNSWASFTTQTTQGNIAESVSSGQYVGGQAVVYGGPGQTSLPFDLYTGDDGTAYAFDIRSGLGITVVFAASAGADNPTLPDFGPLVGISANNFFVRTINAAGANGTLNDYTAAQNPVPGGQAATSGNWYRMTVKYDAPANALSVKAIDLTMGGTPVTTGYESIANLLSTTTFPDAASRQGFFDSLLFTVARVTAVTDPAVGGAIDNIDNAPAATPTRPGDFDSDGDVDGADFVAWQTNFPTASGANRTHGDGDNDGDVDGADFDQWQQSFPAAAGVSPIPEPHTWLLSLVGAVALVATRLAHRRHLLRA